MLNFFRRKDSSEALRIHTDIHSHLIPSIDDGSKSIEESIALIREFEKLGFQRIITTPHIMHDVYPNDVHSINKGLAALRNAIQLEGIEIELEVAAEYYLDETFLSIIDDKELLAFGDQYILFETAFHVEPLLLKEVIFKLNTNGYKPILAHPERYSYLMNNKNLVFELKDMDVLFQVNLISLIGFYSKEIKKFSEWLLKNNTIDLIGSDCHNLIQMKQFSRAMLSPKVIDAFKNRQLLNNIV